MIGTHELLAHRDPACTAGFSAVTTRQDWKDDGDYPVQLELRCWTCLTSYTITPYSIAIDQAEVENYQPPREHKPFLSGLWPTKLDLPAAWPTEKHGPIVLHPNLVSSWGREVIDWLAADSDGNVVGQVTRYRTRRDAIRYRWCTWYAGDSADGFQTPRAACKQLAQVVGL